MRKLTEQQIETIKEQIDDSISIGVMSLKVGIVLKDALNEALTIPAVMCSHEKTTKHTMTGIIYCSNPKCQKLIDIR